MTRQRYSLLTGLLLCLLMTLVFVASRPAAAENDPSSKSVTSDFVHQTSLNQPGEIGYLTEASSGQPFAIVTSLLQQRRQDLGLTWADTATTAYVVSDLYQSDHNGVTHVYLQQTYHGIRVYNAYVNSNVTSDGRVLNLTSAFIPGLSQVVNGTEPNLTAEQAVNAAANHLGLTMTEPLTVQENLGGASQAVVFSTGGISLEPIPAKLVYQPMSLTDVRLTWDVEIYELDAQNYWTMRLDAQTGEVLSQQNYVVHENHDDEGGHSYAEVSEEGVTSTGNSAIFNNLVPESYRVFAIPVESPSHGVRTLELNPYDPIASDFGWHDINGVAGPEYTITRGNNVHADTDLDANNTPDGNAPDGGAGLVFDYAFDDTQSATTYRPFAITNLFYWNNIIHDVSYLYGFNEVAGNFQENNYGNGGAASDYVYADAQDGSGTNNANFSTPSDGTNPRMQMYIWTYPLAQMVTVNPPSAIAGNYFANPSNNGGTPNGLTADVVLVNDGTAPNTDGCQAIINNVSGKIALIVWNEGACNSSVFVGNAATAGAVAVIIIDNTDVPLSNFGGSTAIPSVAIGQADGQLFLNEITLSNPINATMDDNPTPLADRDSDIDSGVITHEYGHGISNRLTGGPSTTACLNNQEQMGEGWSDWQGLFFTTDSGNNATESRGVGTYLQFEATNGVGIRPTAYSTDMTIDPATYGNIDDGGAISIPHGLGYVWNSMLWEMYWNLVSVHGFNDDIYQNWTTGGNNLAYQLVSDGMKLQPCSPGFVTGRDAILAADLALTGGDNQCLIWEGFAKRGLGYSAAQGSSSVVGDETEAFDMPPTCSAVPTAPSADVCVGSNTSFTLNVGQYLTPNIVMSGSVDAAGTSVSFTPNPVTTAPSTTTANISTTGATPGGSHTVTFTATDSVTVTAATTATLVVYTAAPSTPALTTPTNGATNVSTTPTFVWSAVSGAATYTLEVDDDSGFGSIDYTANVAGTSHTATSALANETTYYWRVKANNACGASSPSTTFSFTTEQGIGYIYLPLMTNNTTIGSAAPAAAAPTSASPSTALAFVPALLGLVFLPFWRQRR
jgi:extracellular elastinolytic metalloproteinase